MKIRELITKIGFDVDSKTLDQVDRRVNNLKFGLKAISATAGAATIAMIGIVKSAANSADALQDSATAIGVSTTALQELGYAATLSGASVETMANGLRFLSKNLVDAAANPSSDLGKKFKQLGINLKDSNGRLKTADVVFKELADSFVKIQDPAEKVNLSMALLGKSGASLIQTLNNGSGGLNQFASDLAKTGNALTPEQIKTLAEFNDQWDIMKMTIAGFKNSIGASLAEPLGKLIKGLTAWFQINGKIIKSGIVSFFKVVIYLLELTFKVVGRIVEMFISLINVFSNFRNIAIAGLVSVIALLTAAGLGVNILNLGFIRLGLSILRALAPFLLMAAGVVLALAAIFLVVEDLYTYFTGGDSVFGEFMKSAGNALRWVRDKFNEWIVFPIQNFFGRIGRFFPESHANRVAAILNKQGVVADINPMNSPIQNSINKANSNVNVNSPITVNVPPGTDPSMVGERIESGVGNALLDIFSETQRFTGPAGAY